MIRTRPILLFCLTMIPLLLSLGGCTTFITLTDPAQIEAKSAPVPVEPKPAPDYIEPVTGMELVHIKGGTFMMGDLVGDGRADELPAHQVTISDFYIGKYEVTFAQYDLFCEATGHDKPSDRRWGRDNRPAMNLSWNDAVEFTLWLSKQSGKRFRLPSESEWEYAARAGTATRFWWGNEIGSNKANCRNCGSEWDQKMTAPVGSFAANNWGLYDTVGNVAEFVLDSRDSSHLNYQEAPNDGSPWLSQREPSLKVARGGSFRDRVRSLRVSSRAIYPIAEEHRELGLRLVMEP